MILVNDGLPSNLIMVDLEMTGVNVQRDQPLQVAMLKLSLDYANGKFQYVVKDEFNCYIHNAAKPANGFHRKYMSNVYKLCNHSTEDLKSCKLKIAKFVGDWRGKVTPVGDCVITDLRFLFQNILIDSNDIIEDKQIPGTFHYEIWDMNMPKQIANQKLGRKMDKKDLPGYNFKDVHDALVDCYNQTLELNYLLNILLN